MLYLVHGDLCGPITPATPDGKKYFLLLVDDWSRYMWGEAVTTAIFLLNRAPTKANDGMTPYEAWHRRRLDVHFLCTFGCVVYVKAMKPHLKKLDDRGTPVVFLSYEPGAKAWLFYDPAMCCTIVSRDAVFDELTFWSWEDEGEDLVTGVDLVVEYHAMELGTRCMDANTTTGSPEPPTPASTASPSAPVAGKPVISLVAPTPPPVTPVPVSPPLPQSEFVLPPLNVEEYWDADNDDAEPRYHTIDNILRAASPLDFATC
ncbi:hypothetical protein ABZP36_012169 [Zizania latifolia]